MGRSWRERGPSPAQPSEGNGRQPVTKVPERANAGHMTKTATQRQTMTDDNDEGPDSYTGTTPNYPPEACNDNGPYPQDVAIRWAAYSASAVAAARCDITISGKTLTVTLAGQHPNTLHVVHPGDGSGTYPQITTGSAGGGSTTYTYTTSGTYTVTVARDDGGTQTVIATLAVDAV